jgi:hypothetical protein
VAFPDPSVTVKIDDTIFKQVERLPSFLDKRASDFGLQGYGSENRIRSFIMVPFECREAIKKSYNRHGLLSGPVVDHLFRIPIHHLVRMTDLWQTIEDCLYLSSIEIFSKEHSGPLRRIFRWFVSSYVYSGHTATIKAWKTFVQFVKQRAAKAEELEQAKPVGFPWYDPETGLLQPTGIFWLDCVAKRGVKSKGEMTRFMHFMSSRGAPTPVRETKIQALAEHQLLRCKETILPKAERLAQLYNIGVRIARRVDKRSLSRSALRSEHLSVTNSSCMENPRSKGGRSSYVRVQLQKFANFVPDEDREIRLVLGHCITIRGGIPFWKSFTPVAELTPEELDSHTAWGDPIKSQTYMQKFAGFNKNLGYLLLQWSFEEGVKEGILDPNNGKVIGNFRQRAIPLGEPGDKTRCLTVDPAWVTVFLTPFGHILVDTLRTIPEAAAGLGFGEPAFRFLQEISKISEKSGNKIFLEYSWFLSMDLDKATDHFHKEKSRYLLRGYLHGLGKDFENPYNLLAIQLLLSDRICVWTAEGC